METISVHSVRSPHIRHLVSDKSHLSVWKAIMGTKVSFVGEYLLGHQNRKKFPESYMCCVCVSVEIK